MALGAGLLLALILLAAFGAAGGAGPFALFAALASLVFAGAGGFIPLAGVASRSKHALLHPAVEALGFTHTEKDFDPPAYGALKDYRLFDGHDRATFEDRIDGPDFALCEAHLTKQVRTKNSTHTVTVFRGLIGRVAHPARILGQTVLARRALAGFAPPGMKRAGLGVAEFERLFALWTTDQVEARYLVTPLVMQRLLELETQFHGKKLRAAFADGHLYFALESSNLFEAGSVFAPLEDPARMKRLIGELASVRALTAALRALPAGR